MTHSTLTPQQVRQQIHSRLPYLSGLRQPETRLDELELDSLDTMELLMLINELYGVRFSRDDIGQVHTVGELAAMIATRQANASLTQS